MPLTIGKPHDPVQWAKKKEATLKDLLNSRTRAWHAYIDDISVAYDTAYTSHTKVLNAIKERIRNQNEFMRTVLFGAIFPSMLGGGVSILVSNTAKDMTKAFVQVATANQKALVDMAIGAGSSAVKDITKLESSAALNSLVPDYGSEWNAVADSPLRFFLLLQKSIDAYATDATNTLETMRRGSGSLEDYVAALDGYLLSPFISKAPMQRESLYQENDLAPVLEIFLWIVWARQRDVKYWVNQITEAAEGDDRGFTRKILTDTIHTSYSDRKGVALAETRMLDPILERLLACGLHAAEISQPYGEGTFTIEDADNPQRFLNILWVKVVGQKHARSLLGDLVANLDAKTPKTVFDGGPVTRQMPLL